MPSMKMLSIFFLALLLSGCGVNTPKVADGKIPYFFPSGSKIYIKDISQVEKMVTEKWGTLPVRLKNFYPEVKMLDDNKIDLGVEINDVKKAYQNLIDTEPLFAAFPVLLSGKTLIHKARIFPYDMDEYEDYCAGMDERIADQVKKYYTIVDSPEKADYSIYLQVVGCGVATPNRIVYPLRVNTDNWHEAKTHERITNGLSGAMLGSTFGGIGGVAGGVWGLLFTDKAAEFYAQQVVVTDSSDNVLINRMVQGRQSKSKRDSWLKNMVEGRVLQVLHKGPDAVLDKKDMPQ